MADPTLVERVEQALVKATPGEWGADSQIIAWQSGAMPGYRIWWRPSARETAAIAITHETNERAKHDAALIAHAPEWLAALVAEVRRLEGAMRADDERLKAAAIAAWGEDRHGCDTAEWLVDEILSLRLEVAAMKADWFRAGADAMREAAAQAASLPIYRNEVFGAVAIRSLPLPVPPAPSPAHDGKEGAPRG